jgi:indole-3-glycerol phosphate synthase
VQGSPVWAPPTGALGGLVQQAHARAAELAAHQAELERKAELSASRPKRSLAAALRRSDVAVLAEVKRRSPSKGWIQATLDAPDQARAYERGGASAISVLTEREHFGGSNEDLEAVLAAVELPVLKKDFHVHPLQLLEAKGLGATAALLIARALSRVSLRQLFESAHALSLEVLVEVRDEEELERALELGAPLVGINNRNLETLEIDHGRSERLLPCIPERVVVVAESGISVRGDVERLARSGAHAVLVGSSVSAANDPESAVRDLIGLQRSSRADRN